MNNMFANLVDICIIIYLDNMFIDLILLTLRLNFIYYYIVNIFDLKFKFACNQKLIY